MNTFEAVLVKPEAAGMKKGDKVRVTLERDTEPRTVAVPAELQAALAADPRPARGQGHRDAVRGRSLK